MKEAAANASSQKSLAQLSHDAQSKDPSDKQLSDIDNDALLDDIKVQDPQLPHHANLGSKST